MTIVQNRIVAGTPTGGQFAAAQHAESAVSLAPVEASGWGISSKPARFPDSWRDIKEAGQWRRVGFSYAEAIDWTRKGFVAADAKSWIFESFDNPNDAEKWRDLDFTPAQAAGWVFNKFDAPTAAEFRSAGILQADSAFSWVKASFTADQAHEWAQEGFRRPSEAKLWRYQNFDPQCAAEFRSNHFSPSSAAKWRDAGFSSVDAEGWGDLGLPDAKVWAPTHLPEDAEDWIRSETVSGPAEAMEWESANIEPRDVDDWRKAGCPTAFDAQPWRERSFSAAETCMWRAQRFEPEQAERYRGQGLDPRRPMTWTAICSRSADAATAGHRAAACLGVQERVGAHLPRHTSGPGRCTQNAAGTTDVRRYRSG